jgi:hypothetical protein
MSATLPPEYDHKLRTIARAHNRYLVWIVGVWFILTVVGLKISQTQQTLGFSILGGSLVVPLGGVWLISQWAKKKSVVMGLVCPLCGASLYEPPHTRLLSRGECPKCKQPVIEALGRKSD